MSSFLYFLAMLAQPVLTDLRQSQNEIVFRVQSDAQSVYVLEQTSDLGVPWNARVLLQGTGELLHATNEIVGSAQFIRARVVPRVLVSKPGVPLNLSLGVADAGAQWKIEGEVPEGIQFADGRFSGEPTEAAAEKLPDGNYTNLVRLQPASGRESTAALVHQVRLSYLENLYKVRPGGPALGTTCLACHGSGFPPDFTPKAATLIKGRSGDGGECPPDMRFVTPGDLAQSLVYQKIASPACGQRMPDGGPNLSQSAIDRVARWISELGEEDDD